MAGITFAFLGCTNHEMVYVVTNTETETVNFESLHADGTPTPDMVTDSMPRTPLRDFVAQTGVISQSRARTLIFGYGLDGEHSAAQLLLGEAYLQGLTGTAAWDLDADTDGAGAMMLTVRANGATPGTAYLRIRSKHTMDR